MRESVPEPTIFAQAS